MSLYFVGYVISLFIVPRLADIHGRKFIITTSVLFKAAILQGIFLTNNVPLAYTLFFLYGLTCAGSYVVAYIYLMEVLPNSKSRTIIGVASSGIEGIIGILCALFSKYFHKLSYLYIAETGIVMLAIAFFILIYLPESPTFLLRNCQQFEYKKVIHRIAVMNGSLTREETEELLQSSMNINSTEA